jgi:hypothetical protein
MRKLVNKNGLQSVVNNSIWIAKILRYRPSIDFRLVSINVILRSSEHTVHNKGKAVKLSHHATTTYGGEEVWLHRS